MSYKRVVQIYAEDLDKVVADMKSADPQYETIENRELLTRLRERQKAPYCCHLRCGRDAEFSLYGSSGHFEDTTQACAKHVGKLLGTPEGLDEDNTHWTVYPIK